VVNAPLQYSSILRQFKQMRTNCTLELMQVNSMWLANCLLGFLVTICTKKMISELS
jgi:hypothetical protein